MFKNTARLLAGAVIFFSAAPALAEAVVGEMAPEISTTDVYGNEFNLSDHKGKIVVLEWTNHECPFVIKHYDTGNMQSLQAEAREMEGVEWVTIVSSAEGMQGHVSAEEAVEILEEEGASPTTKLLDESGEIGKAYGAKTTPHMFVVDTEGKVAYAGAIDDNSSPKHETVEGAKNYVMAAVSSLKAGEPVEVASTAPYGCSVKYAN